MLTQNSTHLKEYPLPISSKTLSCLQQAGAAVFNADTELKSAVKDYAEQVQQAMLQNPFDMGNDGLFEEWKTAARLSLALEQIEAELRKIYSAAGRLNTTEPLGLSRSPVLAAPTANTASSIPLLVPVEATDVVIKQPRKAKVSAAKGRRPLKGNGTKLLARLMEVLNPVSFTSVNRAEVGRAAGLAVGSIGAAITQLMKHGYLIEDASRGLKLMTPVR